MATKNLTAAVIEALRYNRDPITSKNGKLSWPRQVLWDAKLPGFGVRVTPANQRSYVITYRVHKRSRFMHLGRYEDFNNVSQARDRASEHLRSLRRDKVDPLKERQRERSACTIKEMFETWLAGIRGKRAPRTIHDYQYSFDKYLIPEIGTLRPTDLERPEVRQLHARLTKKHGPVVANRALQVLRACYSWTNKQDSRTLPPGHINPVIGIEFNPESTRDEYIRPEEIGFLTMAIQGESDPWVRGYLWLLLLTGARGGELVKLKWKNVSLNFGFMLLPKTKNRSDFRPQLSDLAVAVLRNIPATASEHVFPAQRADAKAPHMGVPRRAWGRVLEAAGINRDVRRHDLRRTVGVFLSTQGFTAEQIAKQLNHKSNVTAKTYIQIGNSIQKEMADTIGIVASGDPHQLLKNIRRTATARIVSPKTHAENH